MATMIVTESGRIPSWVVDLPSFRKWVHLGPVPERGRFGFLAGILWVDLTMERSAHNDIKMAIGTVLRLLARGEHRGLYYGDGMLLTNLDAILSCEPDGMYISAASLAAGKAVLEQGNDSLEVIGTADMVLEVISPSSVEKDTKILRRLYWKAGIPEYWLVDSRDEEPELRIYRRGRTKYIPVRSAAGWVRSAVFRKLFRLVGNDMGLGVSEFTLEVK